MVLVTAAVALAVLSPSNPSITSSTVLTTLSDTPKLLAKNSTTVRKRFKIPLRLFVAVELELLVAEVVADS